jgi:uncharacterized protein (DUF4415 family)
MDAVTEKKKVGRPPTRKALLTLRLEPEVVEFYRGFGPGWLQGVNDALKATMEQRIIEEQKRQERNAKRRAARKG